LFTNPHHPLEDIFKTHDTISLDPTSKIDADQETSIIIPKIKDFIQKYEQKCPFFYLGECTADDCCIFTRKCNPYLRAAYETKTSSLLLEKIQAHQDKIIHTVHFGCGGALSDLVIITKTLVQQPNAKLHIHLIDGNNNSYITMQDYFNKTHEIKADQSFEWNDCYIAHLKKIAPNEVKDMSDTQIKRQIIVSNLFDEIKYQQFIRWLQYTFPNATLSLSIHSTQENYLEYVQKNNIPYADIVTAADIQDEISMMRASVKNYAILCQKILQLNPDSSNIWLMNDNNGSIGFGKWSLEKPNNLLWGIKTKDQNNSIVYLEMIEKIASYTY